VGTCKAACATSSDCAKNHSCAVGDGGQGTCI
jgi:hypothetical protein